MAWWKPKHVGYLGLTTNKYMLLSTNKGVGIIVLMFKTQWDKSHKIKISKDNELWQNILRKT